MRTIQRGERITVPSAAQFGRGQDIALGLPDLTSSLYFLPVATQVKVGEAQPFVKISNLYRVFVATPIADNNVLIDVAVRPSFPITLPISVGATDT